MIAAMTLSKAGSARHASTAHSRLLTGRVPGVSARKGTEGDDKSPFSYLFIFLCLQFSIRNSLHEQNLTNHRHSLPKGLQP